MFKFKGIVNVLNNFFKIERLEFAQSKEWKDANKKAEELTGLKRLLVYRKIPQHAGVYSTITDVIDTLEDHEKRINKIKNNLWGDDNE